VVLEAVFADLREAFARRIDARYPRWLHDLCPAVCWMTEKRLRLKMADIRPAEAVKRFGDTPILAIVGENDRLTPPSDVWRVAKNVPHGADFALVAGAGHNDLCDKGGPAYHDRVLDFLSR
jgi:pimeloyl-ACP methyl ester carboxylesterase